MHTDAAVGAWTVLHPAGMEAVVGLEFTPVRHWSAFEAPACRFVAQIALTHFVVLVGIAVAVGAVLVILSENTKMSFGGRCRSGSHGNRHDEQWFGALHHVDHLMIRGYFYPDLGAILGKSGWAVICLITGNASGTQRGSVTTGAQSQSSNEHCEYTQCKFHI